MIAGDVAGSPRAPEAICRHCGAGIASHGRSPTGWAHLGAPNAYRCPNGATYAQAGDR